MAIIYVMIVLKFINLNTDFNLKLILMIILVLMSYIMIIKYNLIGLMFSLFFYIAGAIAIYSLFGFTELHLNAVMAFQLAIIISSFYLYRYVKKVEIAKNELYEKTIVDELTGAYNRRYSSMQIKMVHELARSKNTQCSVFALDIDNFKTINDTYGHQFGDLILKEFAIETNNVLRSSDTFSRIGGDEFLIIAYINNDDDINIMANRLNSVSDRMNLKFGDELNKKFSISIGVSVYPKDADSIEEVIQCADSAMYEAKAYDHTKIILYNELIK